MDDGYNYGQRSMVTQGFAGSFLDGVNQALPSQVLPFLLRGRSLIQKSNKTISHPNSSRYEQKSLRHYGSHWA